MKVEYEIFPGSFTTALGRQLKYCENNLWYKIDYNGYEAAAEYICSCLSKHTNLPEAVNYSLTSVSVDGIDFTACYSLDFLGNDTLVSANELFDKYLNINLDEFIKEMDLEEKIVYFVTNIEKITKIPDYGQILSQILDFDAFVINEGRTFDNIHFLYNENSGYRIAPLFDYGDSLLSDICKKYPSSKNYYEDLKSISANPFDNDFSKQISVCHSLYGKHLIFDDTIGYSQEMMNNITYYYGEYTSNRIKIIIDRQLEIYKDIFVKPKTNLFKDDLDTQIAAAVNKVNNKRISVPSVDKNLNLVEK